MAALSGSQFRVHVFTILIFGRFAHLIFWDRNGAVVSRAFDYTRFHYLGLFLQQYNLNVDQRGHDPSVTIPSLSQLATFDLSELKNHNVRHREFRVMLIPNRDDPSNNSEFLISYPPKYTSRSPFGRATRPMLAIRRGGVTHCVCERLLEACRIRQGRRYLPYPGRTQGAPHRHV